MMDAGYSFLVAVGVLAHALALLSGLAELWRRS